MRVEFTDGTAIWCWSDGLFEVEHHTRPSIYPWFEWVPVLWLNPGHVVRVYVEHVVVLRTVAAAMGDDVARKKGIKWQPLDDDYSRGHPRSGVLYRA